MKTSNSSVNQSRVIAAQYLPDAIKGMIQQKIARLKQEYSDLLNCKVDVIATAKAVRTLTLRYARSHHVKNQTDCDIYESDFLSMTNIAQSC